MDVPWLISYYIQQTSDFMHHTVGDRVTEVLFKIFGPAKDILSWVFVPFMVFLNGLAQSVGALVWFFALPALGAHYAFSFDESARAILDNGNDSNQIWDKFVFWTYKFTYQAQLIMHIGNLDDMSKPAVELSNQTIAMTFFAQWLLLLPNLTTDLFAVLWVFFGDTIWDNIKLIFSKNWFAGIKMRKN